MVTLAGRPEAVSFYRDLAKELKRRVALGEGESKNERFRLMYDKFPPWHDMKMWNHFDEAGAVFVVDFYCDAFSGRLSNPDPNMALVKKSLYNPDLQIGIEGYRKRIENNVRDYSVDGAVFMSNKSCRYFSLGQFDLASYIRNDLGIPVLVFDGDHMDSDRHSKEMIFNQIELFLEMLSKRP